MKNTRPNLTRTRTARTLLLKKAWLGMNWIRQEKRLAIYLRDEFRCAYCSQDMTDAEPGTLALDHLIARSKGGSNHQSNLVTICRTCNSRRGNRPWRKFANSPRIVARITLQVRRVLNIDLAKELREAK